MFAVFDNPKEITGSSEVGINNVWERIRDNVKISSEERLRIS